MYIAPNSVIRLLTHVPIDKNQTDTLWFANVTDQINYFASKTKVTCVNQSYQRVQRGYARLEVRADTIYDCNYMMFQNTNYGSKWFYAFINNVEYINNEVSEIHFTIDPVQSWFFDYTLHQCWIERCTPATDNVGENIQPEPVQLGEYVINGGDYGVVGLDTRDLCFVVLMSDPQHNADFYGGGIYNNVPSAGKLYAFGCNTDGILAFNELIINSDPVLKAPDALLMLYMCPVALVGKTNQQLINRSNLSEHLIANSTGQSNTAYTLSALNPATLTLDGYSPRNKKCFTYPYTFYSIDNGQGQSMVLRYEFFDNLTPKVRIGGNSTYPVELTCFPYQYKNSPSGSSTDFGENRMEKLSIKGFPQGAWAMDSWAAWVAQNSVPILIDGAMAALPMIATAGMGAIAGGAMAGTMVSGSMTAETFNAGMSASSPLDILGTVGNIAKQAYSASIQADIVKGSIQTGSNDASAERLVFKGGCMTLPYTIIRNIDKFFDMFGYAQNRYMNVNIHARTRWTYVKTIGANIDGSLPADDAQYIANCYDRGIRFWADTASPCDYTARNLFIS